jgi:hypothetical protein
VHIRSEFHMAALLPVVFSPDVSKAKGSVQEEGRNERAMQETKVTVRGNRGVTYCCHTLEPSKTVPGEGQSARGLRPKNNGVHTSPLPVERDEG